MGPRPKVLTPDDEVNAKGEPVPFIARWNILVGALIVEPSVKLVARTAAEYGLYDGEGVFPGNERLARQTSLSAEAVRSAWTALRALGMAERTEPSHWNGKMRTADEYQLVIPENWRNLPIYGEHFARFRCQHCGKAFNPQPGTHVRKDGSIGYFAARMVFCPDPGRPKRTAAEKKRGAALKKPDLGCYALWNRDQQARGLPGWDKTDVWKLFAKARNDGWP